MRSRLSLTKEIILQLTLLMAAALLFVSFLVLTITEQALLQQQIKHNLVSLQLFAKTLPTDLSRKAVANQLQQAQKTLSASNDLQSIAILYPSAELQSVPLAADWVNRQTLQQVSFNKEPAINVQYTNFWTFFSKRPPYMSATIPLPRTAQGSAALQARFSLDKMAQHNKKSRSYALAYTLLYGLILVLFGSYLLGKAVVRPIARLQKASRRIADGELDQQIPVDGPKEISDLADSFNRMSTALLNSQQQTDAHIESLERINEELKKTRQDLLQSEKMAAIGHLAAGLAHEIGNPLGALTGYLELLDKEVSRPSGQKILAAAQNDTSRIDRLVRDLLDYARPGSATDKTRPGKIIEETVHLLDQQQNLASPRLLVEVPEDLPVVLIDGRKLQQVLINLLLNARDADPDGSLIRLTAGVDGTQLWIKVTDRGPGVPAENLPHLFDPFFTTKAPGKGRGLGLYVSHYILQDAGGRIEVTSDAENGTSFTLYLPLHGVADE